MKLLSANLSSPAWLSEEGVFCSDNSSKRFAGAVALAGFCLTVLAFYPGFMSNDSLDQFRQSLRFQFTDWHPPIMAFVWSVLNAIWTGPQPMLFLQATLYWSSVFYLVSTLATNRRLVRWIIVALLFSPAILNFAGVIWKDVQLAAAWSLSLGSVFAYRSGTRPMSASRKAGLLTLVIYGALVRLNAGLVAGPLVLYVLTGRPYLARLSRTLIVYIGVALAAFALGQGVKQVLNAEHTPVVDALLSFDIAGVSIRTKQNLYPFPLEAAEMDAVTACYGDASKVDGLIWGQCGFVWQKIAAMREQDKSALFKAWLSAVVRNPAAYLSHRLKYFAVFLAVTTKAPSQYFWHYGIDANSYGLETRTHGLDRILFHYVKAGASTFLFRPVTWLVLPLVAMIFLARSRSDNENARMTITAALVAGSYILTYLPLGVASDFRYVYLSIVMTTFALCVLASELRRFPSFREQSGGRSRRERALPIIPEAARNVEPRD